MDPDGDYVTDFILLGLWVEQKMKLMLKNFHWHPVMFLHQLKALIQVFKAVKGSSSSYIRECILIFKSQKQRYFSENTENEDHKSQNKACKSQGECILSLKRHSSEGILCLSEDTRQSRFDCLSDAAHGSILSDRTHF